MHVGKVQTYIPDKVHTLSSIEVVAVNVLVRQLRWNSVYTVMPS